MESNLKIQPLRNNFRVAILGARGSFHELAAAKYFNPFLSMAFTPLQGSATVSIQYLECRTFKDVFRSLMNGEADFGITAIENTVAGTILPNYAMLRNSNAKVIGEVYLHIQQNLLTLKGQTINDITEVHSHPMAILQCQNFFEKYPHIRLVEADDTAGSAKKIAEKNLTHIGAIAGTHVAKLYNLEVIAESIETHKKNFTRFLIIQNPHHPAITKSEGSNLQTFPLELGQTANKSSLYFTVIHQKGSLAKVLTQLAEHDINLTKIQSLPIVGREWEYYIHIDMEFDNYSNYQNALTAIKPSLSEINVLGEYRQGEKYETTSIAEN